METTLLAIRFTRKENEALGTVEYRLVKDTPFGKIEATRSVDQFRFATIGATQMDGLAWLDLSKHINEEENNRLLEDAANSSFGAAAAA